MVSTSEVRKITEDARQKATEELEIVISSKVDVKIREAALQGLLGCEFTSRDLGVPSYICKTFVAMLRQRLPEFRVRSSMLYDTYGHRTRDFIYYVSWKTMIV